MKTNPRRKAYIYLKEYASGLVMKQVAAKHGVAGDTVRDVLMSLRKHYGAVHMAHLVKLVMQEGKWEL
jgi:hypothetical protein